jgi:hypothetical protein
MFATANRIHERAETPAALFRRTIARNCRKLADGKITAGIQPAKSLRSKASRGSTGSG